MRRYRIFFIILMIAFVLAGCDNVPLPWAKPKPKKTGAGALPPKGAVVVSQIGNFFVTRDDLDKDIESFNALMQQQGMPQNKIDTREKKINYLRKDIINRYLLYQEALDRGLDRKDDISRAIENTKISLLVAELLREETQKINVTGREIEEFYNKNKEYLKEPEQRKVSEIVTPSEADAKQIYIELLKGTDFAAMARQSSTAKTASKGGDLGYIALDPDPQKRVRFDKFYEVAFAPTMDKGGISSIFKGPEGYYIIKLEDIKKSEAKSLSELWDNIKSYLLFEKQQKAVADLANKLSGETKIEIYDGKVD